MSNTINDVDAADWTQKQLSQLSQRLEQAGEWPESADRLWQDLAAFERDPSPGQEINVHMLSLAVNHAFKGEDIAALYPDFYVRLLADSNLCEAFLDSLDLLEKNQLGQLLPLPAPLSRDLTFLQTTPPIFPQLTVNLRTAANHWSIHWQQTMAQLQAIFFPAYSPIAPIYRNAPMPEAPSFVLLDTEIEINQTHLSAFLTAAQIPEKPDELRLQLIVGAPPSIALSSLHAHLQWGNYQATTPLDSSGRATFPPLSLLTILDETGQRVTADLQLRLEPTGA